MADRLVDPDLLFARLRLNVPEARSFLFATVDPATSLEKVAVAVMQAIQTVGATVSYVDARQRDAGPPASTSGTPVMSDQLFQDPARLRALVRATAGYSIVLGGSVLHDARTLLLSAAVDAVVIGCWKERTSRQDLAQARAEIERAGGTIAGAVYFEKD